MSLVVLGVIYLAGGKWYGLLSLAAALLHAVVIVSLRRMSRRTLG